MPHLRHLLIALLVLLSPGVAAAACPEQRPTDTSACGPILTLPRWSDSSGWSAPGAWPTIQLGDVDGAPGLDLLGRNAFGLWMQAFDPAAGQWVQQGTGKPVANLQDVKGWDQPRYFSTIQTGDVTGDGRAEVLARGPDGLRVYGWRADGGGLARIDAGKGMFSDASGWDAPQYYATLQTADIDPEVPGRELLARGISGLVVYRYDAGQGTWVPLGGPLADLSDANGWAQPQYYETIQAADVDGRPGDEVMARFASGVFTYRWDHATASFTPVPGGSVGALSDAGGWAQPQYYRTIQTGDVNGDGRAELIARFASGLGAWSWGADGWVPLGPPGQQAILPDLSDANGFALPQHYATIITGRLEGPRADVIARTAAGIRAWAWDSDRGWTPLPNAQVSLTGSDWREAQHYGTLQAGDVDGDGRDELVVRGVYGIRTFRLDGATGAFVRPKPYGAFPAFTGDQAAAYAALPAYLGLPGDVRRRITDPANAKTVPQWQSNLVRGCTAGPGLGTAGAKVYSGCPTPSGLVAGAWLAVVNEVNAEMAAAIETNEHFDDLDGALQGILVDRISELQAVKAVNDIPPKPGTQADYSALAEDLLSFVADVLGIGGIEDDALGLASQLTYSLADSLGTVVDGMSLGDTPADRAADTWASITTNVANVQEAMEDSLSARRRYALGDYGLSAAIGTMHYRGLMPVDQPTLLSTSRKAFATWAYQTLLPVHWARWRVTDCASGEVGAECAPPTATSPTYVYSLSSDDGVDTYDMTTASDTTDTECWVDTFTAGCDFADVSVLRPYVWAPLAPGCAFNPATGANPWEFGQCSIGADAAAMAQGQDGWDFTAYTCSLVYSNLGFDPCKADSGATLTQGAVPGGDGAPTTVTLQATHPLGAVAPAAASASLDTLLVEGSPHPAEGQELASGLTGQVHDPVALAPVGAAPAAAPAAGTSAEAAVRRGRRWATFAGRQGGERVRLTMTARRLTLRVRGVRVRAPEACSRGARRVTLTTTIRVSPSSRRAARGIPVTLRGAWTCRRGTHRVHAGLRLSAPRPRAR